eukprot:1017883-Pyramimonas_sp.AAC.1
MLFHFCGHPVLWERSGRPWPGGSMAPARFLGQLQGPIIAEPCRSKSWRCLERGRGDQGGGRMGEE